jgi:hypothetical protein
MPRRKPNHPDWLRRYYDSDEWSARKRRYWASHKKVCSACNVREPSINLHHRQYEGLVQVDVGQWNATMVRIDLRNSKDWGKEPDDWFSPLCFPDHNNVHQIDNAGRFKTLADSTDHWIGCRQRQRARRRRYAKIPVLGWVFR